MATLMSTIITRARKTLLEPTASFWSDAELLEHGNAAIKELWKGVIDLYKDHIVTIDETNVTAAANTRALAGVPTDLFKVRYIEPRVVGSSSPNLGLIFKPRDITHPDFVSARAARSVNPRCSVIFYAVLNAGAPVGAPAIHIAPMVSSAVNLAVGYVQVIADKLSSDANPIPGESDKAIEAYIIAQARAKEREDRSPDPEWISVYATEKRNILTALTPRSEQEPETVVGMFEPSGDGIGDYIS